MQQQQIKSDYFSSSVGTIKLNTLTVATSRSNCSENGMSADTSGSLVNQVVYSMVICLVLLTGLGVGVEIGAGIGAGLGISLVQCVRVLD